MPINSWVLSPIEMSIELWVLRRGIRARNARPYDWDADRFMDCVPVDLIVEFVSRRSNQSISARLIRLD
jgi:hypothetical protein